MADDEYVERSMLDARDYTADRRIVPARRKTIMRMDELNSRPIGFGLEGLYRQDNREVSRLSR